MKIYHTSPDKIEKITKDGRFGEFLFFASEPYQMAACDVVIYSLSVDSLEIIEAGKIFCEKDSDKKCAALIENVMEIVGCDEETAKGLIDESENLWTLDCDIETEDKGEISWDLQRITATAAKILSYDGVEVEDEQGVSYLIDMFNRESQLEIEND